MKYSRRLKGAICFLNMNQQLFNILNKKCQPELSIHLWNVDITGTWEEKDQCIKPQCKLVLMPYTMGWITLPYTPTCPEALQPLMAEKTKGWQQNHWIECSLEDVTDDEIKHALTHASSQANFHYKTMGWKGCNGSLKIASCLKPHFSLVEFILNLRFQNEFVSSSF